MKKVLIQSFSIIICFMLFFAAGCNKKMTDADVRDIMAKAIFIPVQAFQDAETLYIKSTTTIE